MVYATCLLAVPLNSLRMWYFVKRSSNNISYMLNWRVSLQCEPGLACTPRQQLLYVCSAVIMSERLHQIKCRTNFPEATEIDAIKLAYVDAILCRPPWWRLQHKKDLTEPTMNSYIHLLVCYRLAARMNVQLATETNRQPTSRMLQTHTHTHTHTHTTLAIEIGYVTVYVRLNLFNIGIWVLKARMPITSGWPQTHLTRGTWVTSTIGRTSLNNNNE